MALLGDERPREDYVIFGVKKTPGVCEILELNSPRNWQVNAGYGLSGASTVFTGNAPSTFKIKLTMWTSEHFEDWGSLVRLYLQPALPGMRPKAIGVKHPVLSLPPFNITSIVVTDVLAPVQDDNGGWTATISCLEYRKPRPVLQKPLAAIPAAAKAAPSAQDAADAVIEAKVAELKGLAGG